jgi:indolepyruvate decarboxylase
MKERIGDFLLRRLEEAGIGHVFGVPGDYNLAFLQQLEDRGKPAWVGNCNELNASYATDAYGRINGIGALSVTHGVGALSAINGIGGAYCEHVPVICIAGSLPLRAIERGDLMHHTMCDREKGDLLRVFSEVTAAQGRLYPDNAATEIDRLILTAWRQKRPAYMELPSDITHLEIDAPDGPLELKMMPSDPETLKSCSATILERLRDAKSPAFLLDLDAIRFGISGQIMNLAERYQMPIATLNCAKGAVPETSPTFVGTYAGALSAPAVRESIEGSDCLLTVGYRRIETTTGFLSEKLPDSAIRIDSNYVDTAAKTYQGVYIAELFQSLLGGSSGIAPKKQPARPLQQLDFTPSDEPLTQDQLWKAVRNFLRPGDVLVVEDGTPSNGLSPLMLPEDTTFISQAFVYCSIGYATGALLGAILASPGRRHFLFTGEGSLQMTAQELSTVMRHGLKPFIFVVNNKGYTVERAVLGKDATYNDVANWRYSELPNVLSRDDKAETYVVRTGNELQKALDASHSGMVFVECVTDKYDGPPALIVGGHLLADSDYGTPGPQSLPNSQIELPKGDGKLTPA